MAFCAMQNFFPDDTSLFSSRQNKHDLAAQLDNDFDNNPNPSKEAQEVIFSRKLKGNFSSSDIT